MKTKKAYVVRSGEMSGSKNLSNKLRTYRRAQRAIRAARRMGYKQAYAAVITVTQTTTLLN